MIAKRKREIGKERQRDNTLFPISISKIQRESKREMERNRNVERKGEITRCFSFNRGSRKKSDPATKRGEVKAGSLTKKGLF